MTFRKIKDDSDSILSWFLIGVSLMFMQEKPLSQSADEIGNSCTVCISLDKLSVVMTSLDIRKYVTKGNK